MKMRKSINCRKNAGKYKIQLFLRFFRQSADEVKWDWNCSDEATKHNHRIIVPNFLSTLRMLYGEHELEIFSVRKQSVFRFEEFHGRKNHMEIRFDIKLKLLLLLHRNQDWRFPMTINIGLRSFSNKLRLLKRHPINKWEGNKVIGFPRHQNIIQ